jgi:hypothetical protein
MATFSNRSQVPAFKVAGSLNAVVRSQASLAAPSSATGSSPGLRWNPPQRFPAVQVWVGSGEH